MSISVKAIKTALSEHGLLGGVNGELPESASGIADDSRKVEPGYIFIAIRGSTSDGHDHLASAARRGAKLAIVQDPSRTTLPSLTVREGRRGAALE